MMIRTALVLLLVFLSACDEQITGGPEADDGAGKPLVLATNYPLYFFASEIAGDAVDVRMPDIDGDPAMWVPGPSEFSQLQTADLIILNGAGYESWLAFTSLPSGLLLDTTADIQDRLLPMENVTLHQHGPEGEHSHQGTAFTTWLNPLIAIEQARSIEHALSALAPTHSEVFQVHLAGLEKKLEALDQSFEQALSELKDQPLVFSHPVYQYLQQRYGLNGLSVHWEPDQDPGVKDWVDFQNLLRGHPAKLMFWEGQPSPVTIERLQDQGIQSVVFDPVANQPETSDYFAVMSANLNRISGN